MILSINIVYEGYMKTIIAGCRNYQNYEVLEKAIKDSGYQITEIVSGNATGVDLMGERFAHDHGVPLKIFPADWDKYGRAAGPKRNKQMANYAEALIALWDYTSAGTGNMIKQAREKGLQVFIVRI